MMCDFICHLVDVGTKYVHLVLTSTKWHIMINMETKYVPSIPTSIKWYAKWQKKDPFDAIEALKSTFFNFSNKS